MGVYNNLYYFTQQQAIAANIRVFAQTIQARQFFSEPFYTGPAFKEAGMLQPPEIYQQQRYQKFSSLDDAVQALLRAGEGMVSATALAQYTRAEPQLHFDWPCAAGLYLLPRGHTLTIGEPEDFSDIDPSLVYDENDFVFKGTVYWLLWLHGKNAPLVEDFSGSQLQCELYAIWPGASIYTDQWL